MPISDKSRKMLWARSGNQCAFCQQLLVIDKTEADAESVVGDEAHIVSRKPKGPRGHIQLVCDHDAYENFILLCKTHHKMVDDQPETYTFEFLLLLKTMHEVWVEQQLKPSGKASGVRLVRIQHGKDLGILFQGSSSFSHVHDNLDTPEAQEAVAIFLECVSDYMDMWDEFGIGQKMTYERHFDQWIADVERTGYWIFAADDPEPKDERGNKFENWKGFIIAIKKNTSPEIIEQGVSK